VALLLVATLLVRGLIGSRIDIELLRPSGGGLQPDQAAIANAFNRLRIRHSHSARTLQFDRNEYARQADGSLI
jgi:hypothetical protein